MKLFISKLHYKRNTNIFEKAFLLLLKVIGSPYFFITQIRNMLYDKNILRGYSSKSFVISIGNITTGGVGKTPFTLEVARYFLSLNKKVAILSRGYGGKLNNREPNLISDGTGALFPANLAGDEPVWLANNCKGAYVVTCSSRIKAERFIREKYNPDIIILDDGFQHRKMKRDLDFVLVDSKNKFGNRCTLPAGPLRESLTNMARADKIVLVNKDVNDTNALKYCDYLAKRFEKPIYLCKLVPDYAYNIKNELEHIDKGEKILAFSAIGQPQSFYDFLKNDYMLKGILEFEDHHSYDRDDISKIIQIAQAENIKSLITTEKDAVKVLELIKDLECPINIYALKLKAVVDIKEACGV